MSDETCKGKACPLFSSGREGYVTCIEHQCAFYQRMIGTNPQTGAVIDHYDCAMRWGNVLAIEAAQQIRQTNASVDQLRADNINTTTSFLRGLVAAAGRSSFRLPWRKG